MMKTVTRWPADRPWNVGDSFAAGTTAVHVSTVKPRRRDTIYARRLHH
jgi:hypothetical protein